MRSVLPAIAALTLLAAGVQERAAGAQGSARAGKPGRPVKKEIESRTVQAMESFDLLEFESARKQLGEAAALARKNGLEREPILARVFLDLGIVEFAGLKNREAARQAFAAAVDIDPEIEIGVAYRTEAMAELLAAVKKAAAAGGGGRFAPAEEASGGDGCAAVEGVEHEPVEVARSGRRQLITARVGSSVGAEEVVLFFRAAGAEKYTELTMRRRAGCAYQAAIPASAMQGNAVHYYVAALRAGSIVADQGSRGSPNIIELAGGGGGVSSGADVSSVGAGLERGEKKKTLFVSLAVGTGGGYVSGVTEVAASDVDCCFAPALLHFFPEVGYYITRRLSLSAAFRMGFALGANVPGHATAAPAGLLRLRYAATMSRSGSGLLLSAAAGGGIIRHTVKVDDAVAGMDTDTTASGPFLAGAGVGYVMSLSGPMRLVAELNGLAAFPAGIEEVGSCPGSGCVRPHFGVQMDVNLGLLFAF